MNSRTAPPFWSLFRRLPVAIQRAAREAFRQFLADPSHPGLQFHRLATDPRLWSARITRDHRAVGARQGDTIIWFWIGTHRQFDRKFPK